MVPVGCMNKSSSQEIGLETQFTELLACNHKSQRFIYLVYNIQNIFNIFPWGKTVASLYGSQVNIGWHTSNFSNYPSVLEVLDFVYYATPSNISQIVLLG